MLLFPLPFPENRRVSAPIVTALELIVNRLGSLLLDVF
jgi:hypothetical protein